jgi:hypothetical protein
MFHHIETTKLKHLIFRNRESRMHVNFGHVQTLYI